MKKIYYMTGGFVFLTLLFTGCYYLSYRSALRNFNQRSAQEGTDYTLLAKEEGEQQQEPLETIRAVEADTSKTALITPSTHYTLENYDAVAGKTEQVEGAAPDYLLGLSREEVAQYLADYMQDLPLEEYQKGLVSYELVSFSENQVTLKKTYNSGRVPYKYCVGVRDNMVVVYYSDKKTVYEYTGIPAEELPQEEQRKLTQGIFVEDEEELYGILENFSS